MADWPDNSLGCMQGHKREHIVVHKALVGAMVGASVGALPVGVQRSNWAGTLVHIELGTQLGMKAMQEASLLASLVGALLVEVQRSSWPDMLVHIELGTQLGMKAMQEASLLASSVETSVEASVLQCSNFGSRQVHMTGHSSCRIAWVEVGVQELLFALASSKHE